jgi:hypothetical protein
VTRRASAGCERVFGSCKDFRFSWSPRPTSPKGEVETIKGVLVRAHCAALTGMWCKRTWSAGSPGEGCLRARGDGRQRAWKTRGQARGRQRASEPVTVRCRPSQLKGAGGWRQERELKVAPARTQVKLSRSKAALSQIRNRDAKPLPFLRSRRSMMVPQCIASAQWGAHRANRSMRVT